MHPPRLTIKSLWRLFNTAQVLLKTGQTRDAATHFHRIAEAKVRKPRGADLGSWEDKNPLVARAKLGLCYCYVEQGRLDQALGELRNVLDLEPTNAEALCELAYILCLKGSRDEARAALDRAIDHNPDSARAHKAL